MNKIQIENYNVKIKFANNNKNSNNNSVIIAYLIKRDIVVHLKHDWISLVLFNSLFFYSTTTSAKWTKIESKTNIVLPKAEPLLIVILK